MKLFIVIFNVHRAYPGLPLTKKYQIFSEKRVKIVEKMYKKGMNLPELTDW